MRRHRISVSLAGLLAALFLFTGLGPVHAADSVTFILDWIPYGSHTGFYTALQKGFFREAGINATVRRGYGSGDTVKLVSAGKGDLGFADTGTLIVAPGGRRSRASACSTTRPHTRPSP